ncbi:anti-sigma factor family protein [Bradyrhizobium betae]|uniref:Anti-sigma factor n=1 Tax=Bradyrhizobium betae TaxID=244734 RepID=A0A5P6PH12_9BRAD|nr:anti-sigma factor [Bradyrhizobium betae]MCS3730933.1 anti-sigma factor RsiW [Bradyrhizobium betae]QFI77601.1 anti-sigma factor [Bradyrhizobium betae]
MTTDDIEMSWDLLNAYVDGELDRFMSAKVAAAVAQDATLAARVATLSKLKAGVHQLEFSAGQLPPLPIGLQGRRFAAWRIYAAAASLVAVLAAGLLIHSHPAPKAAQAWLDGALAAQQQWLASASRNNPDDRTIVTIDAAAAARPLDLSDAQLKLVYVAQMPSSIGGETAFLGYRGPHGCMVGFWIGTPPAGLESAPKSLDAGDFRVRAWRDRVAGYALIAKGMDPTRIDRLAEAVARLVDPGQIVDDGIRTALRNVTRTGTACRV